jgi:hypothetical protein
MPDIIEDQKANPMGVVPLAVATFAIENPKPQATPM